MSVWGLALEPAVQKKVIRLVCKDQEAIFEVREVCEIIFFADKVGVSLQEAWS